MLRWSDRRWALLLYGLAAVLALAEIAILWVAIHPQVSDDYRAYYLTRTTTCLPQPVSGAYTLGTELDFDADETRELRPCGWDGPAGDGMHALGETARLRLATGPAQDLTLMLEMTGVTLPGPAEQLVDISVNDVPVGQATVLAGETRRFSFAVPAETIGDGGFAEIKLDFPNATTPRVGVANNYKRSIKLVAASLSPAR